MRQIAAALLLFLLLALRALAAQDLGVVGKTYEIAETDLLEHIQSELRAMEDDGRLAEAQEELRARATATVKRPPGRVLPRARESRVYYHDPSVTTNYDVVDHLGNVIYKAGTTVNPLEYTSLGAPILLFDGDDSTQIDWVRNLLGDEPDRYLALMTNGPVIELMQQWNVRLYFDQHGRYSTQLGIRALPVVVRQEGFLLRVDEVALETS